MTKEQYSAVVDLGAWVVAIAIRALITMVVWDNIIVRLVDTIHITFWDALGLFVLARCLFGNSSPKKE